MCDTRIDTARLLDHLEVLDRWTSYAWSICGDKTERTP